MMTHTTFPIRAVLLAALGVTAASCGSRVHIIQASSVPSGATFVGVEQDISISSGGPVLIEKSRRPLDLGANERAYLIEISEPDEAELTIVDENGRPLKRLGTLKDQAGSEITVATMGGVVVTGKPFTDVYVSEHAPTSVALVARGSRGRPVPISR